MAETGDRTEIIDPRKPDTASQGETDPERSWVRLLFIWAALAVFVAGLVYAVRSSGGSTYNMVTAVVALCSAFFAALQLLLQPATGVGLARRRSARARAPGPRRQVIRPLYHLGRLTPYAIVMLSASLLLWSMWSTYALSATKAAPNPCELVADPGLAVYPSKSGDECIGISDGNTFFDADFPFTEMPNYSNLRRDVLRRLRTGDRAAALQLWATGRTTNDAEMLIYLENQRVLQAGSPYINLVVTTMLTGNYAQVGRDELQGAYVAQREANETCRLPGCIQVRLLVANSGSGRDTTERVLNTARVAEQIVDSVQALGIKGVMGWPFSGQTSIGIQALGPAHIPTVAPTASSDALSGTPYFWRAAPPDSVQASAAIPYALKVLKSKRPVVFYDPTDPYSSSLGTAFKEQFKRRSGRSVITQFFATGNTTGQEMSARLQAILQATPDVDLIYFAGYGGDASLLMRAMPAMERYPIQFLGGDALYNLETYVDREIPANVYGRLHFTSFGYFDARSASKVGTHPFYCRFALYFDPAGGCERRALDQRYHFNRPNADSMLSYDAMLILLEGAGVALRNSGGGTAATPNEVQDGIEAVAARGIQGASGWLRLGMNGDPIDKMVILLKISASGETLIEGTYGCQSRDDCR